VSGHSLRQGDVPERGGNSPPAASWEERPPAELGKPLTGPSGALSPGTLFVWLILQLIAIAVAAWRIPLAAQYPEPAEFQAIRVLITVQFIGSALLSPVLLRSWQMTLAAACSSGVFILVGALLAGWSLREALPILSYLAAWLLTLFAWVGGRSGEKWRMTIAGIAAAFSAGGPLLWYLGRDLGGSASVDSRAAYGPLLPALVNPDHPWEIWWLLAAIFLGGLVAAAVRLQLSRHT
jgi:hypothetical protein